MFRSCTFYWLLQELSAAACGQQGRALGGLLVCPLCRRDRLISEPFVVMSAVAAARGCQRSTLHGLTIASIADAARNIQNTHQCCAQCAPSDVRLPPNIPRQHLTAVGVSRTC